MTTTHWMCMSRLACIIVAALSVMSASAQGNNTRMGGEDGDYESLTERVLKLEKKTDAFNVYLNYAAGVSSQHDGEEWKTGFANRQLRLEIKGNITPRLYYRLRHCLNRSNAQHDNDNFARATDIMMIGYSISDKVDVMGGKLCQIWGGFEYDQNPMEIYQYSDLIDRMDIFTAGVTVSYKPIPSQEIAVEVCNANNGTFNGDYGKDVQIVTDDLSRPVALHSSHCPLTYIVNWNGNFLGNKLQTRWAWGLQTQARGTYSRMLTLGQRLNLPTVQWYIDYFGEWDDFDRLGYATGDLAPYLPAGNTYAGKVHSNTLITKLNWQFMPQWNLMLKGTYETTSMSRMERFKNYRKTMGYLASVEYYPVKKQDFRLFLAYMGHHYGFSDKSGLESYNTNRVELGFMYRIKCF